MKEVTNISLDKTVKARTRTKIGNKSMSSHIEKLLIEDLSRDKKRYCIKYLKDRGYKVIKE